MPNVPQTGGWPKPNEEQTIRVYSRRPRIEHQGEQQPQGESQIVEADLPEETVEPDLPEEIVEAELPDESLVDNTVASLDLPIALRKGKHAATSTQIDRAGLVHDINNYVSYESLSPSYKAFVASLQSTAIPRDWRAAKQDQKWFAAMKEELEALRKNKTWELTTLPRGKNAVSCKWVYTVKQSPEGKIERYKARLVARGYSQTYGINYDETFAPVAKMNTVRVLVSCAANFGWPLHQLDVKNAFLHGDLQEEVYMEIPPSLASAETEGKVCRLKKALYGLKQSPRAWFDRFRRAVCEMGYGQCNGDHTVFYRHSN